MRVLLAELAENARTVGLGFLVAAALADVLIWAFDSGGAPGYVTP